MRLNGSSVAATPIALLPAGEVLEAACETVAFSIEVEPHPTPESLKAISLNMLASRRPALGGGARRRGREVHAGFAQLLRALPPFLSLSRPLALPPSLLLAFPLLSLSFPPPHPLSISLSPSWDVV